MKSALTVQELCHEIGIGRTKLYSLIKDKQIVAHKLGKRTVFLAADVEAYLNSLPKSV